MKNSKTTLEIIQNAYGGFHVRKNTYKFSKKGDLISMYLFARSVAFRGTESECMDFIQKQL